MFVTVSAFADLTVSNGGTWEFSNLYNTAPVTLDEDGWLQGGHWTIQWYGKDGQTGYGTPQFTPASEFNPPLTGNTAGLEGIFTGYLYDGNNQPTELAVANVSKVIFGTQLYVNPIGLGEGEKATVHIDFSLYQIPGLSDIKVALANSDVYRELEVSWNTDDLANSWLEFTVEGTGWDSGSHSISFVYDNLSGSSDMRFGVAFNGGNISSATPEPATLAVFGLGVAGLAVLRRRKK